MVNEFTFKDLYEYCNTAERDEVGVNYPFGKDSPFKFHIYNGMSQLNIEWNDKPIVVILFDISDDTAGFAKVEENGYVDFNYISHYSMGTDVKYAYVDFIYFRKPYWCKEAQEILEIFGEMYFNK